MKKFIAGFLTCLMLVGSVYATQQYTAQEPTFPIFVDGQEVTDWGDTPPLVVNGRTMLPLKAVGDIMRIDVEWDGQKGRVLVGKKPVQTTTTPQFTDTIKSEGLEIKVLGINNIAYNIFDFEIINTGNEDIYFNLDDFRLFYGKSGGVAMTIEGDYIQSQTLTPQQQVTGRIRFEKDRLAGMTNRYRFRYKDIEIFYQT